MFLILGFICFFINLLFKTFNLKTTKKIPQRRPRMQNLVNIGRRKGYFAKTVNFGVFELKMYVRKYYRFVCRQQGNAVLQKRLVISLHCCKKTRQTDKTHASRGLYVSQHYSVYSAYSFTDSAKINNYIDNQTLRRGRYFQVSDRCKKSSNLCQKKKKRRKKDIFVKNRLHRNAINLFSSLFSTSAKIGQRLGFTATAYIAFRSSQETGRRTAKLHQKLPPPRTRNLGPGPT